ncbi:MAG TPA: sugar transferase [Polyangiaceae bacterium]|nr:sugar transferase [Polyangiaceae bacterium]
MKPVLVAGPPGGSSKRAPAFYKRRRKRSNELGQVLIRNGIITPEQLRQALRIQSESGGHVGAILRRMGACDSRAIADALIEQVRLSRSTSAGLAHRARQNPSIVGLKVGCRPELSRSLLILTDVLTLSLAAATVGMIVASDTLTRAQRFSVLALVPMCVAALTAVQMYGLTPPAPSEEIRRCTLTISLVYAGSWLIAVARSGAFHYMPHFAWLVGWLISVLLVPIGRGLIRTELAKRSWWGQPVVVFGAGKVGRAVVATLQQRPQLGLKPVAILDDDPTKHGTVRATWGEEDLMVQSVRQGPESSHANPRSDDFETPSQRSALEQFAEVEGVPVVGGLELAPILAQRLGIRSVVIAMPKLDSASLLGVIERYAEGYHSVLVIPDLFNVAHFGTPTHSLGGVLGIEVRRQLLLAGPRLAKRLMDVVLTSIGGLLILPFVAVVSILIKLDSSGSIFYTQKRLGQDGVRFKAFKFRTMYGDGEKRLLEVLANNPQMRAEYEEFHKLTVDPRVTRIGKVLRKYSLDELPQIWSVLVGDMSLVGPRPYLEREIPDMNGQEAVILRVKPGITGIWQVTERNASTFEQRVQLDVEYVRSWSPWLDLYVLARTIPVVLGGTGS